MKENEYPVVPNRLKSRDKKPFSTSSGIAIRTIMTKGMSTVFVHSDELEKR